MGLEVFLKKVLLAIAVFVLAGGFVMAQNSEFENTEDTENIFNGTFENTGTTVEEWQGFNISGRGDFSPPGTPTATLYETYTDITGTYNNVLKLDPPEGGYRQHSLAMTYEVHENGDYKLSAWVLAEQIQGDIYIEFEHIGGDWESISGSVEEPAAFQEGQWLYITTDSDNYPDGVFLRAGEKFGLLTQGNPGVGLNNHTIYIRDLQIDMIPAEEDFSERKNPLFFLNGLFVGLEFGINSVNNINDEKVGVNGMTYEKGGLFLNSSLGYEKSFFNDAMYIYTEVGIDTGFYNVEDENGDDTYPVKMYLDAYADYSLDFGNSTLSFILADKIDPPLILNPRFDSGGLNMVNRLAPGIKFNQWFDNFGSLYTQVDVPFYHFYYWKDNTDSRIFIQGKLGWSSDFGLGIWVREDCILKGDKWEWAEPGHESINCGLSYWTSPFSANLEVNVPMERYGDIYLTFNTRFGSFLSFAVEAGIPREIEEYGVDISLTPRFQYTFFQGFTAFVKLFIGSIGSKEEEVVFSPSIGVIYSF